MRQMLLENLLLYGSLELKLSFRQARGYAAVFNKT